MQHKLLTNENFEVLLTLYDKRDSKGISRTTQNEIAEELGKSRQTIIKIFKKLKDEGYLEKIPTRACCYLLTDRALEVVRFFKESK